MKQSEGSYSRKKTQLRWIRPPWEKTDDRVVEPLNTKVQGLFTPHRILETAFAGVTLLLFPLHLFPCKVTYFRKPQKNVCFQTLWKEKKWSDFSFAGAGGSRRNTQTCEWWVVPSGQNRKIYTIKTQHS